MSTTYVVDTSEWINLDKKYPSEIFPSLWNRIEDLISKEKIVSPNTVRDEIKQGHDGLEAWIRQHPKAFHSTDKLITQVQKILKDHQDLIKPDAHYESADPYIIALAISIKNNLDGRSPIIVTDENAQRPSRIPYVSRIYGVSTCKLLGMFQREEWNF